MLSEVRKTVYRLAKKQIYCPFKKEIRNYDVARCSFSLGMFAQLANEGKIHSDELKKELGKCLNHYIDLYGHTRASKVFIDTLAENLESR